MLLLLLLLLLVLLMAFQRDRAGRRRDGLCLLSCVQTEGIVLICATNLLGSLDSALLRPGRVDKTIFVPLPSLKERKEV